MPAGKRQPAVIRIATRTSRLATAQAREIAELLGVPVELVGISTRGDRSGTAGGKGLFTAELEVALRRGEAQLAVHSAKDLPAEMSAELVIAATPARQDPRDALVSLGGASLAELPAGARVGTGSGRRAAQLLNARPDLNVVGIRGNVDTRLAKLRRGDCQAIVLAMAGLNRLGLTPPPGCVVRPLAVEDFVPAAGQGALAVQCLASDRPAVKLAAAIDDPPAAAALAAERSVVRALGADCRAAVGVHVRPDGSSWTGLAMAARPDGARIVRVAAEDASAAQTAAKLLDRLVRSRAMDLIRRAHPPDA